MIPFPWHRAALERLVADRARLPHALLVQGTQGIGKAEFARALAAALLCETPQGALACGKCPSCHWFSQGNHPDFREVIPEIDQEEDEAEADAAKADVKKSLVIKIDQIRALADFMALTTHRSGLRVLLIHPAEVLQSNAANALLKTLEEPPPATLIVLVSDQPARLLPTIRSRCRVLPLPTPPANEAMAWLQAEGVEEPRTALAVAGGAPLLARELAAPEEVALRRKVMAELTRPSGAEPLTFAERIDRPALDRTIYWMQTWVQDLLRVRVGAGVRHHLEHESMAKAKARAADADRLFDLERELRAARRLATHPLNARLLAEHLLMTYNRATSGTRT
ncbi:DNA polymerase III subunit delta' [Betaproteobacteria bacterium GR16-43]|nr:DNA polymerase III subunit delta' [Betaproteobacteria bacterium GR16-43]